MAYRYARNGARHFAVSDVYVAGTDAAECDAYYGITWVLYDRSRFVEQGELPFIYICICKHGVLLFFCVFKHSHKCNVFYLILQA